MSDSPDTPQGGQESASEASAEERAPQTSGQEQAPAEQSRQAPRRAGQEQAPLAEATGPKAPAQQFYWRRQAEKLEKELGALRAEREAEVSRVTRDRDEAATRAAEAEWRAERLGLIATSGLPSELFELVPLGDPEMVATYIEKLRPIAEKLTRMLPRGLTNTNPPNSASSDDARLERLASEASRGDRRALREYAHLRQRTRL